MRSAKRQNCKPAKRQTGKTAKGKSREEQLRQSKQIKSSPKSLCSEIYIESDKVHATTAPLSHPSKQVIVVVRVTPLPLSFPPTASSDPLGPVSLFLFSRLPSILTLHLSEKIIFSHILQNPKLSSG